MLGDQMIDEKTESEDAQIELPNAIDQEIESLTSLGHGGRQCRRDVFTDDAENLNDASVRLLDMVGHAIEVIDNARTKNVNDAFTDDAKNRDDSVVNTLIDYVNNTLLESPEKIAAIEREIDRLINEGDGSPARHVATDQIPPKNWLNNPVERDAFSVLLCAVLNIDRPAEFSNTMHPKTMIDKAVWIRPKCPREDPELTFASDYIVSKIPGLYEVDASVVATHREAARNFREFLVKMIDLDNEMHPNVTNSALLCKGGGCINDEFRKSGDAPAHLPCADCVHQELEKMLKKSFKGGEDKWIFDGASCFRDLKPVLESEIRGENLSFAEIQRREMQKERMSPSAPEVQKYPARPCKLRSKPKSKDRPQQAPICETPQEPIGETQKLEPALKQMATALGQLLPTPAKKITVSITYES